MGMVCCAHSYAGLERLANYLLLLCRRAAKFSDQQFMHGFIVAIQPLLGSHLSGSAT